MDLISRQAAIEAIKHVEVNFTVKSAVDFSTHKKAVNEIIDHILDAQEMALEELPTIEPERKTGKWEQIPNNDNGIDFRCSECHRFRFHNGEMRKKYKYCPNCGANLKEDKQ